MGKARLLVVGHNISLCKTMSFVLEHKGYAVTITTTRTLNSGDTEYVLPFPPFD